MPEMTRILGIHPDRTKAGFAKPRIMRLQGLVILGPAYGRIEVDDGHVVLQKISSVPWKSDTHTRLGKHVKTIDTSAISDHGKAVEVVEAEVERMRGELKDPTLEAVQLTSGALGVLSLAFAVYAPAL